MTFFCHFCRVGFLFIKNGFLDMEKTILPNCFINSSVDASKPQLSILDQIVGDIMKTPKEDKAIYFSKDTVYKFSFLKKYLKCNDYLYIRKLCSGMQDLSIVLDKTGLPWSGKIFKYLKVDGNSIVFKLRKAFVDRISGDKTYSNIDSDVSSLIKSRKTAVLFKIVSRYLNIGKTAKYSIDSLKQMFNIDEKSYLSFSQFKYWVLNKVVKDLKMKTGINVVVKYFKIGGRFLAQFMFSNEKEKKVYNEFGFSKKEMLELEQKHGHQKVHDAISKIKSSNPYKNNTIKNKKSYLLGVLSPSVKKSEEKDNKEDSIKGEYDSLKSILIGNYVDHLCDNLFDYVCSIPEKDKDCIVNSISDDLMSSAYRSLFINNGIEDRLLCSSLPRLPFFHKISSYFISFEEYLDKVEPEQKNALNKLFQSVE